MRKDMYKVIVERPRQGGGWSDSSRRANERRQLELIAKSDWSDEGDDSDGVNHILDNHEPIRNRCESSKSLNENLAPLYRFLDKSVGRPWDEVYSEIREHLRLDSSVQLHVVQHVKWAVTEDTYIAEDGHIYEQKGYRNWRFQALDLPSLSSNIYYVHPKTKLLCRQPRLSKKAYKKTYVEKKTSVLPLDKFRQFRLIDGDWKVVELAAVQVGNPDQAAKGRIVKYDYKTQRNYVYPDYDFPDVLFPDGLKGEKRYDEYGDYNLYATVIRDVGARERKILETLLKKE